MSEHVSGSIAGTWKPALAEWAWSGERTNVKRTREKTQALSLPPPVSALLQNPLQKSILCFYVLVFCFSTDSKVRGSRDHIHGPFPTLHQLLKSCLKQFGTVNICEIMTN